jgi:hypothetical protein
LRAKKQEKSSEWEVFRKNRDPKHGKEADSEVKDNDGEKTSNQVELEQAVDDAFAKTDAKNAKKAAKRAKKLAQALKDAKPPVGPKEEDIEDSGNDSDWTQTSWSPSWASDSE